MRGETLLSILFFFVLITSSSLSNAFQLDDTWANARLQILNNQKFIISEQIQCRINSQNSEEFERCNDQIKTKYPEKYEKPELILEKLVNLEKPTPEKIVTECGNLPTSDSSKIAQYYNCRAALSGRYNQTISLINQGINPNGYFNKQNFKNADPLILQDIAVIKSQVENLSIRRDRSIYRQWKGLLCEADGADFNPIGERPDCRISYNLEAPKGYQFCQILERDETESGDSEIRWNYMLFDDEENQSVYQNKIKSVNVDLHAIGGPWHDRYKSVAKVNEVILEFIPIEADKSTRESLGCVILEKPPVVIETGPTTKPESDLSSPDVSVNVTRSPTSTHSGRVDISGSGAPPWEISYTVEALREGKWYGVADEHIKITKPNLSLVKDYYWYDSESWRVVNLSY